MYRFSDIKSYHAALVNESITCKEIVSSYLEKISRYKHLNAFTEVYAAEALLQAEKLDNKRKSGERLGKLHGVVIALKDVICFKGHEVTAASRMLKGFKSLYNAKAVQCLIDEDAIIIGNCNCDEFAMGSSNENSVYGPVLHPLDNNKVPGGSSGGSAVAVSAGLCMLSLGSDTGGSVRQPADFCGVIGLKPGYGSISRHGLIAYASSFDQIGIFGNNAADVALVLEVISQPDNSDSTMDHNRPRFNTSDMEASGIEKYRIAVFRQVLNHPSLDSEIRHFIQQTLETLQQKGHQITELDFELIDYIVPTYYVLTAAEASSNLSRYDGIRYGYNSKEETNNLTDYYTTNRTEGFGKEVKRRIMLGNFVLSSGYYDAYFTKAQQVRRMLVEKTEAVFKDHDFIVMPVSPTTAFGLKEKKDPVSMYLADIFTVFANLTGLPAIATPLFRHSNGLPFGIQLLGQKNSENLLLSFSNELLQTAAGRIQSS